MGTCQSQGNPDLYGLGIRLGFYFQWFGQILIEYVDETDVSDIRLLGLLLSGAVILSLIIRAAEEHIQPTDVYIILLLAAGTYIFLIPIHIWRVLTCCTPAWDPLRWTREVDMPIYDYGNSVLLLTIASLGVWCFTTYMPMKRRDCSEYGFLFTKIRLDNAAFMVINVVLYMFIILVCVGTLLHKLGFLDSQLPRSHRRRWRRRRGRVSKERKDFLRVMRGISNITVYGLQIAAIELTIDWNHFDNVNAVNTSAQTIPLLISIGIILRIILTHYHADANPEEPPAIDIPETAAPNPPPPDPPAPAPAPAPGSPEFGTDEYWLRRMEQANREAAAEAAARAAREAQAPMQEPAQAYRRYGGTDVFDPDYVRVRMVPV